MKENKQINTQQKQGYPDSVASYDTQPGNEVGLFYNGPEHHMVTAITRQDNGEFGVTVGPMTRTTGTDPRVAEL